MPREKALASDIKVNSESVRTNTISAEFTKAVCPEIGVFKIKLINSDQYYSSRYSLGQVVEFYSDFTDGTTLRFYGIIDKLYDHYDSGMGYILDISGVHLTYELLDILVTKSYSSSTINQIIIDFINNNLTDYTLNFISTNTSTPKINWEEKSIWDCLSELAKLADAECYVSDTKVINFFDKGSILNTSEAIVWNDTMIEIQGLGTQNITTKNKIKVYGEDTDGLPVISQSIDTDSQTEYGNKELAVFDTSIQTTTQAKELGDAEIVNKSNPEDEGESTSLLLPSLNPGDKIYITDPVMKINGQYRVYKFTHIFPDEKTKCTFAKERKLSQILKSRANAELALQKIVNPFQMIGSINFPFNDSSGIATSDTNIQVTDGKVLLSSGTQGVLTTEVTTLTTNITTVQLRVIGTKTVPTTFQLSTDGGGTYQTITPEVETTLTVPGNLIVLKITIQDASTELDSIAVLYK